MTRHPAIARARRLFDRHGPRLAALVGLAVLAWLLARWTWVFVAPAPKPADAAGAAPVLAKVLAERIAARHLFGAAPQQAAAAPESVSAAPANLELRGLYAPASGRAGFAILSVDGRPVAAVVGQEVTPGAVLERVRAEHVLIRRGGRLERLDLALPGAARPAAAAPGGARLTVRPLGQDQVGVFRSELAQVMKTPARLAGTARFGRHPHGGLVLEDCAPGGLVEQLGLRAGDVVRRVNQRALNGPEDAMRLYQQFFQSDQVMVEVLREGRKMMLTVRVLP